MHRCHDMRVRWAIRRLCEESTLSHRLLGSVLACLTHRGCVGSTNIEAVGGMSIVGVGTRAESIVGQSVGHLVSYGRI